MEERLKNILSEKFDSCAAHEVLPDFDKQGTWTELAGRLSPQKRQTRLLTGWLPYAAVLAGGLLIGGATVYCWSAKQGPHTPEPSVGSRRTPVLQDTSGVPPNVAAMPAPRATASANSRASVPKLPGATKQPGEVPQQELPRATTAQDVSQVLPSPTNDSSKLIANTSPSLRHAPGARAIHLLDVESDDKTALIKDPGKVRVSPSFTIYISPGRLPGGESIQSPSSVFGNILR